MKRVAAIIVLTLAVLTWSAPTAATAAPTPTVMPTAVQGPPLWQSDWSAPKCVYLYACAQAMVSCVIVGYADVLCTAYARSYFAPNNVKVYVKAELLAAGWPPATLATSTRSCIAGYRDSPYGTCTHGATSPIRSAGVYVARAIVWYDGDPRPRPIATAQLYVA